MVSVNRCVPNHFSSLGVYGIDLFASRLNNKLPSWEPYPFYALPPLSVITKCLQKIDQDQATGVLTVPFWKTQEWFSVLMNLLVDNSLVLSQAENLLTLLDTGAKHRLRREIKLIACKLSGPVSFRRMFLAKQQTLLCKYGQKAQLNNTVPTPERGWICVEHQSIIRVLDYLTSLFERGLKYDAINTAKSAISAIANPKNGISLEPQLLISYQHQDS